MEQTTCDATRSRMKRLANMGLLALLCYFLFFFRLAELPFYERGEPREGLVVQEMLATGDWILPLINSEYIPYKPPLFHWVGILAAKIFGAVDEFSVRFPSALFAALGVLLTYFTGARLWGERAGMRSATVLISCFAWWYAATMAQVDMTLAFFTCAAMTSFYLLYRRAEHGWPMVLGPVLATALAVLAKGPLGLVLPILTVAVFLVLRRDLAFLKKFPWLKGATVVALVAGPWYGLATWKGGRAFLARQIIDENLLTAAGVQGHPQPLFYFVPVVLENILPWSYFFAPLAVYLFMWRRQLEQKHLLYPLVWFVAGLVLFSLSSGKRAVYILPLYPAVALLIGAWWQELEKGERDFFGLARAMAILVGIGATLVSAAFLVQCSGVDILDRLRILLPVKGGSNLESALNSIMPPAPSVAIAFGVSGLAGAVSIWAARKKRWAWVFNLNAVIALAGIVVIRNAFDPYMINLRTLKPFMTRVKATVGTADGQLYFYRSFDLGATFYWGKHLSEYRPEEAQPEPPLFFLIWEDEWQRLPGKDGLSIVDASEGKGPVARHRMLLVEARKNFRP